jgi:hypothetical protein
MAEVMMIVKDIRILICVKLILERSSFNCVHKRFQKNVTTKDATYECINEILSALKAELIVSGNFCNLAKAWVNHDTYLFTLHFHGITGKANEWIKSYLRERYQRVMVKI